MPVRVPVLLPAVETLKAENIFVIDEQRASSQDIRPLRIGILNLMPLKNHDGNRSADDLYPTLRFR